MITEGKAGLGLPAGALQAGMLPVTLAIDWNWGIAMGLGILGGWLGRLALLVEAEIPWADIRRHGLVSLLALGGTIIGSLFFAQLASANALGAAAIGFAVAASGTRAVTLLRDWIIAPIMAAIRNSKPEGDGS